MIWLFLGVLMLVAGLVLALRLRSRPAQTVTTPITGGAPTMHDCPRCGNSIAVDWAFCPFCARALAGEEGASQNGERPVSAANAGRL